MYGQPSTSLQVLIAEDDYLVALLVKQVVLELGYEVVGIAANGLQAVDMVCQHQPDVVLMDIEMPKMDGLQATAKIEANCPTPVIALTAYTSEQLVQQASQVGIGAYVIKPPQGQELKRAIILALAHFEEVQNLREMNQVLQESHALPQHILEMITLCAQCKKVRTDSEQWEHLEAFLEATWQVSTSHGLCPTCLKALYPNLF